MTSIPPPITGTEKEVDPNPKTKTNNLSAINFAPPHADGLLTPVPAPVPVHSPEIKITVTASTTAISTPPNKELFDTIGTLRRFSKSHEVDPNLPVEELGAVDTVPKEGNVEKGVQVERELLLENSPYPEVRAAVRPTDDPSLPASTIRAWTIGLILTSIGTGINCLFSLRNPSIALTTYAIQLIACPLGLFWDLIFPDRIFALPFLSVTFNLRPGKFNYKEHTFIVVMANAAYAGGAI